MVVEGKGGVLCVEAGGPRPGVGCAGRGHHRRLRGPQGPGRLQHPSSRRRDLRRARRRRMRRLRDAHPRRLGQERLHHHLGREHGHSCGRQHRHGRRDLRRARLRPPRRHHPQRPRRAPRRPSKVEELACDLNTTIVGRLPRSAEVQEADALGLTVLEHAPSSGMADRYRELARHLIEACAATRPEPARGGFTF